ncbi:MAG: hypothetical protein QM780_05235 [Hyphomicrobium sp.]|uniref:hypothetical protein n=1 Tax=Hyphomicrobium sp. TaxID=82 RepID=UPI0039E31D63
MISSISAGPISGAPGICVSSVLTKPSTTVRNSFVSVSMLPPIRISDMTANTPAKMAAATVIRPIGYHSRSPSVSRLNSASRVQMTAGSAVLMA